MESLPVMSVKKSSPALIAKPKKHPFLGESQLKEIHPDIRELSSLTERYFDSSIQRDFVRFLAEKSATMSEGEVTKYGGKMTMGSYYQADLGYYNPEEISVATIEKMRRHPQVAIGLAMIRLPIMSLNFRVESESDEVIAYGKKMLTPIWLPTLKDMLTAIPFGFFLGEKVFSRGPMRVTQVSPKTGQRKVIINRDDVVVVKKVKGVYPSNVRIKVDSLNNFKQAFQVYNNAETIPIPPERTFRFTPDEEFGNFFGRTRLKAVYKPWYQSEVLMQFMLRYFERQGTPATIVWAPPGRTKDSQTGETYDNLDQAKNLGYALLSNSVAAMPFKESASGKKMWDITMLGSEQRGDMFVSALSVLFAMILRGMFVPDKVLGMNFDAKYDGGANQADFFILMEESLVMEVERSITNELLLPCLEFNDTKWALAGGEVKMDRLLWSRRSILKEVFMQMIRSVNQGLRDGYVPSSIPSFSEMAGALDIPMAQFDEVFPNRIEPVSPTPGPDDGQNDTKDKRTWGKGKDNAPEYTPRQRSPKKDQQFRRSQYKKRT